MPRKLLDTDGNEIEVPTQEEIDALSASASKVGDLEKQLAELSQDINPNWRKARELQANLERERDEWKAKAESAGVKSEPQILSADQISEIARKESKGVTLEDYKQGLLERFGDKKDVVEKYFNKLSAGEELTKEAVRNYIKDSARAVGIDREPNPELRARYASSGTEPIFETDKKEDFTETPEGQALSNAMFGNR